MFCLPAQRTNARSRRNVPPCVRIQKIDDRHAKAIAVAATCPTSRFVALTPEAQIYGQNLKWLRDQLIGERTAMRNQIRSVQAYRLPMPRHTIDSPSAQPEIAVWSHRPCARSFRVRKRRAEA